MRLIGKSLHITAVFFLLLMTCSSLLASADSHYAPKEIKEWQIKWGNDPADNGFNVPAKGQGEWISSGADPGMTELPNGVSSAWTRIELPAFKYVTPAVYIKTLYALHVKVYVEDRMVFEDDRSYIKDNFSLLVPLSADDDGKTMYIWTSTLQDRIGIKEPAVIGEYSDLMRGFIKNGLIDVILGGAFVFVAVVLFVCGFFLDREHFHIAASLAVVIAATGVLSITYSPFIYTLSGRSGTAG